MRLLAKQQKVELVPIRLTAAQGADQLSRNTPARHSRERPAPVERCRQA
jgi:hypothetical protein